MKQTLYATWLATPIQEVLVMVDEEKLYLVEFKARKQLEKQIAVLEKEMRAKIVEGRTKITDMFEAELAAYFAGDLTTFETPIALVGTSFQKRVWESLCQIPYGETISYKTLAERVGNPTGFRAVANANGRNKLSIIVPCHRVVNHNGKLGGYSGGLENKIWLLQHESNAITLF